MQSSFAWKVSKSFASLMIGHLLKRAKKHAYLHQNTRKNPTNFKTHINNVTFIHGMFNGGFFIDRKSTFCNIAGR